MSEKGDESKNKKETDEKNIFFIWKEIKTNSYNLISLTMLSYTSWGKQLRSIVITFVAHNNEKEDKFKGRQKRKEDNEKEDKLKGRQK